MNVVERAGVPRQTIQSQNGFEGGTDGRPLLRFDEPWQAWNGRGQALCNLQKGDSPHVFSVDAML
jgi:hypothetical protein